MKISQCFAIPFIAVLIFSFFWTIPAMAATTWYASPSGSGTACTSGSPCTALQAYLNASGGDTIMLANGSYGSVTFTANSHSPASAIVMEPQSPTANGITFGTVTMNGATWLTIQGSSWNGPNWTAGACHSTSTCNIQISELGVELTTSPITANDSLVNVNINGGIFYIGGNNITIEGGGIGPGLDYHPQIAPASGWQGQAQNFLWDGVYFHDWTRDSSSVHIECMQVAGTTNLIIRNSRFQNCSVFDLSFTNYNSSGNATNLTLENNWFAATNHDACSGCGQGFFTVNLQDITGGLIDFNSAAQGMVVQKNLGDSGTLTITGNNLDGGVLDGVSGVCISASTTMAGSYNYNVSKQGVSKCSSTDSSNTASNGFVNESGFDFHLTSGATAIHFVPLSQSYPSNDNENKSRPDGTANEAGASEYVGGSTALNPPSGLVATVQ